jgi:hypothetical protein
VVRVAEMRHPLVDRIVNEAGVSEAEATIWALEVRDIQPDKREIVGRIFEALGKYLREDGDR